MGGLRRLRRQQRPKGVVEDLRQRGERVWEGFRGARSQARHAYRQRREHVAERVASVRLNGKEERSMLDKLVNRFTLGFGLGYVLGARAGRQRYEQIVAMWERFAGSPVVRQAAEQGKQLLDEGKERISDQIQAKVRPERVGEVMTPMPTTVRASQTLAEA